MSQISIFPKLAKDTSTAGRPIVSISIEKRLKPTPLPTVGTEIRFSNGVNAVVLKKYFEASTCIIEFGCLNRDSATLLATIQRSIDNNWPIIVQSPEIMEGAAYPTEA